ncbi:MAG TPA: carboxypeptidase-like regulatory domain-containing protein [Pyrinomonadaceae bacterium]|nr:carboxypeptidase-like regulatory domain-containing protein [Pyrinomonadaceae bacterium]
MRKILTVLAMVTAFAFTIAAQSNTGNLVVNVSDASGVIPGATVMVKDEQTGKERTLVTSNEGSVTLSQLDVGTYTVTVTAQGRKKAVYTQVKIDVGSTATLTAVLEAGDIKEVVEVVAGSDIINSANGEISNTVGTRQIQDLPLNGRNPLALITLQAGTSSNGATNTVINGQRTSFTNITRDGLNIQDNFIRSNATDFVPDRPNVDDVGEFTITTQNAGVESGYGGSQILFVTPRGSNDFRGAAYIYNRNSKFAANGFIRNFNGVPRPFLNRNQFGGRLGGPILRNRLFFFGAYEGFRLRQSTNVTNIVLTPSARNGIFTYLDGSNTTRTLNIFTAQQTGGPTVTAIDPVIASRIIAKLPAGNNPSFGDGRNTIGYSFTKKQNQDREAVTTRFDYDLNTKNTINGVYAWRKENLLRPDVDNGGYSDIPFGFQTARTYTTNVAWRFTPSGRFTNEFRAANQLSRPQFDRTDEPTNYFLTLPLITSPESTFQKQGRDTSIWTVSDNAVYTWGNHTIKFGGVIAWYRIRPFGPPAFANSTIPTLTLGTNVNTPTIANNATNFPNGIAAGQLGTGNSLLALLGGIVSSQAQSFNVTSKTSGFVAGAFPTRRLHFENYAWYLGDSWRINQQLTLNYGIRHEIYTPVSEPSGLALEPVLGGRDVRTAILDPNGTYNFVGTNVGDNRMFKPDRNNIGPNVSVAWSPDFGGFLGKLFPGEGKTVIRGGFSINYVNDEFVRAADNALSGNQGLTSGVSQINLNGRLSTFTAGLPAPTFQVPRTYAQNNALASNFGTVFAIDPDLEIPGLYQWNIGVQRELPWKLALEVRYVGNKSNNLVRGIDLNQVILSSAYLSDFNKAVQNCILQGATLSGSGTPLQKCTDARYNPAITGSQPLTFFDTNLAGGLLNNATVLGFIRNPTPADLAILYAQNLIGNARNVFLPNPNTGVVDLLTNSARSRYDSLQVELRRRLSGGVYFQANYTLGKALTDASGVGQTRFDPPIDNANIQNEYAYADFNTEHVFNLNAIYEIPIGKGRKYLNQGGILDYILGGWQFSSIVRWSSGAPISITDPRGTLNRAGRSGRQTANSSLTNDQISALIGIYRTPCGVFWIDPSVININQSALNSGNCSQLLSGATGRAANGFDPSGSPFSGQVFFNVAPGFTGNMSRNTWNGPVYFNWDASLMKNFRITERVRFQIRAEAFNVLNRANFFVGVFPGSGNVNSTSFGRVSSSFDPRIIQFVGRIEF